MVYVSFMVKNVGFMILFFMVSVGHSTFALEKRQKETKL